MIGGKVLDASALAALARRRHSALVWFDIAPTLGLTLYVPSESVEDVGGEKQLVDPFGGGGIELTDDH